MLVKSHQLSGALCSAVDIFHLQWFIASANCAYLNITSALPALDKVNPLLTLRHPSLAGIRALKLVAWMTVDR
jgi:hypothetical protein